MTPPAVLLLPPPCCCCCCMSSLLFQLFRSSSSLTLSMWRDWARFKEPPAIPDCPASMLRENRFERKFRRPVSEVRRCIYSEIFVLASTNLGLISIQVPVSGFRFAAVEAVAAVAAESAVVAAGTGLGLPGSALRRTCTSSRRWRPRHSCNRCLHPRCSGTSAG